MSATRLIRLADAIAVAQECRRRGERVVLANGCFDLLHVGHIRYLEGARQLGDFLIVAINSDSSVRRLKGEGRPVLSENARATLIAALASVDRVTIFDQPDVNELLERIRPAIHAKGTDYTVATVPEAGVSRRLGIETAIAGDPKDHSTQSLLARIAGTARG